MKKINNEATSQHINDVINYLETNTQFIFKFTEEKLELTQKEDMKKIVIDFEHIEKVLTRQDVDESKFLQVNFTNGTKILITKSLVGFKPNQLVGFDLTKIPRVVTTIDLQSVSKAIEDLFDSEDTYETQTEIEILKKVYQSILYGAENVGFKMQAEKTWLTSVVLNHSAVVA
ncbi:MAG: hypothetical protein K0R29_1586 [Pseudobdellovibrio sp.]|nr:hypothetical protein [Pseudobdellovibrio sp.]